MFIEDLAIAYKEFQDHVQHSIFKLKEKKSNVLQQINNTIYISDILVKSSEDYSYGEAKSHTNPYEDKPQDSRLLAHLSSIFNIANAHHHAINCENDLNNQYRLKADKLNHITRLSTPEFFFYTKKPLSINKFNTLYQDLYTLSEKLEPNVHVLLSSFAVKHKHGKLLNISMYIEGGRPPKIHCFCKNTASTIDVYYANKKQLFAQQEIGEPVSHHADMISGSEGHSVYTGSTFEVKTAGGSRYTQVIDVCLDHLWGHGKAQIHRQIVGHAASNEIIPEQIEHSITSNSVELKKSSIVAKYVHRVDPRYPMEQGVLAEKTLNKSAKHAILQADYRRMYISESKSGGYWVKKPPFGSDFFVETLEERPVSKYTSLLELQVKKHNEQVINNQLVASRQRSLTAKQLLAQKIATQDTSIIIGQYIGQLKTQMLKKCQPLFLQKLFKTEEYKRSNLIAEKIIKQQFEAFNNLIQKEGNASVFSIRAWEKELILELNKMEENDIPSLLKGELITEINKVIHEELAAKLDCDFDEPTAPSLS